MKKKYIQPNDSVSVEDIEQLLLNFSGGNGKDQGDEGGSCSKKHDFTDDSFDNIAWPKSKSPWED